jgi:hypothetical protein
MAKRQGWFLRGVDGVRAIGAGTTLWHFLGSQAAAVYIWGPLVTALIFLADWLRPIPLPYLMPAAVLAYGGIVWCFTESARALDRFRERYQKLKVSYDRNVPSCRADVTFADNTHSVCFRLRVENVTTGKLHNCEGWLESTDRFPHISPTKLFWAGGPEEFSVDLINGIPRFLQICRIRQDNRVIMATEHETWPIDSLNAFQPGQFVFKIGLKGEDNAETIFYSVRLNWTGNWTTAEMMPVVDD